ncbi:MAG: SgcJ/EcaC family oxidoreductase [Gammaproteobacteria bacterium]
MNLRMNMTGLTVLFSLLLLAPAAALADSAEAQANKLNTQWNAAFNQGDAAAVAGFYAEDAVLSPGNGKALKGRTEIQGLFQSFIDNGVHSHSIEIIEAHQSGDVLYQVAEWQAQGENADGEAISFGGVLSNTFRRNADGNWQSHLHVWNAGE